MVHGGSDRLPGDVGPNVAGPKRGGLRRYVIGHVSGWDVLEQIFTGLHSFVPQFASRRLGGSQIRWTTPPRKTTNRSKRPSKSSAKRRKTRNTDSWVAGKQVPPPLPHFLFSGKNDTRMRFFVVLLPRRSGRIRHGHPQRAQQTPQLVHASWEDLREAEEEGRTNLRPSLW